MNSVDPLAAAAARAAALLMPAGASPIVARASGRLDVLGGVADYSGGRVVQLPLQSGVAVVASLSGDGRVVGYTTEMGCGGAVDLAVDDLVGQTPEELGARLRKDPALGWSAYALGPLSVIAERLDAWPEFPGLRFLVHGDLPAGAGLASSAALEVAALRAFQAVLELDVDPAEHATIAQRAEHVVAGAPCGLMDQVVVCHGETGMLLPLDCRPMTIEGSVAVPDSWQLVAIASGARHAVAGQAYARARAAAFMGRALIDDARVNPWLAAYPAPVLRESLEELPQSLTGAEFLGRGLCHGDPLTSIDSEVAYPVRAAVAHAVFETERASRFLDAVAAEDVASAGACLRESHASYEALGLGCPETDALAAAARKAGFTGARVSGGGAGGAMALVGPRDADLESVLAACPGSRAVY